MSSPQRLRGLVEELARARGELRALMLADQLRQGLASTRGVDRVLFDDAAQALAARGWSLGLTWSPTPLRAGETWLLLDDRSGAIAARIHAVRGAPGSPSIVGADAAFYLERAYEGLVSAMLARSVGPPEFGAGHAFRVESERPDDDVRGPSLGLSACVALVSSWLGRPPPDGVVGSAEVCRDGKLAPVGVEPLSRKLGALARATRDVWNVVIARGQVVDKPPPGPWRFERCDGVLDALVHFDLTVDAGALPLSAPDRLERRLARFVHDNDEPLGREGWMDLARQAWTVSAAFGDDPIARGRALSWAMLFALHGGDDRAAALYRGQVTNDAVADMEPAARIWHRIGAASAQIDAGSLESARAFAQAALDEARGIPSRELRRQVLGRALGTLGRTFLHDERYADAMPLLREGVEVHARELPHEEPRSLLQLATCMRLAGRAADALATADRGLERMARLPRRGQMTLTERFFQLERARCLFELGEYEPAREAFAYAAANQADADNPRTSALRGLARAARRVGDYNEAERALRACLAVAGDVTVGPASRRVAALAAGEALLDAHYSAEVPVHELRRIWTHHHGDADDHDAIKRRIRRIVY